MLGLAVPMPWNRCKPFARFVCFTSSKRADSNMLTMKQPIAGVTPAATREVTIMTVYPTLGASAPGRLIGRLCSIRAGVGFFTLGKLFALLLIPVAIGLFAYMLAPGIMRRYRLTNRRVVVQK